MKNKILFLCAVAFVIVGCTVARVTPADPIKGTPATTNIVVDPRIASTVGTAGAIADAVPVWGAPARTIIEAVGGLVTAVSLVVARRKNTLLKTVIQGVENSGIPEVKVAIAKHAEVMGVETELGKVVHSVTN